MLRISHNFSRRRIRVIVRSAAGDTNNAPVISTRILGNHCMSWPSPYMNHRYRKQQYMQQRNLLTGETKSVAVQSKQISGESDEDFDFSNDDSSSMVKPATPDIRIPNDQVSQRGWVRAPTHHFQAQHLASHNAELSAGELWTQKYNRLADYYKSLGYIKAHVEISRKDEKLNRWIERQRFLYNQEMRFREREEQGFEIERVPSILTQERIDMLDRIYFSWRHAKKEERWLDRFHQLAKFQDEHGHCNAKSPLDLRNFVYRQREKLELLKLGKKTSLRDDQIVLLDGIGFDWRKQDDYAKQLRKDRIVRLNDAPYTDISKKDTSKKKIRQPKAESNEEDEDNKEGDVCLDDEESSDNECGVIYDTDDDDNDENAMGDLEKIRLIEAAVSLSTTNDDEGEDEDEDPLLDALLDFDNKDKSAKTKNKAKKRQQHTNTKSANDGKKVKNQKSKTESSKSNQKMAKYRKSNRNKQKSKSNQRKGVVVIYSTNPRGDSSATTQQNRGRNGPQDAGASSSKTGKHTHTCRLQKSKGITFKRKGVTVYYGPTTSDQR